MNATTTDNLNLFHARLVETHQLLFGNMLASSIADNEKRWDTLSKLAIELCKKQEEKADTTQEDKADKKTDDKKS
jgi:hypothetical protein